jgi:predicted anti-sigma-YlaC factor YlaD
MTLFTCREVPDVASDYISREGSKRTRLMVAIHLAQCSNCRTYIRGLKIARSIAAESLRGSVPTALLQNLGLNTPDRGGSFKEPNE